MNFRILVEYKGVRDSHSHLPKINFMSTIAISTQTLPALWVKKFQNTTGFFNEDGDKMRAWGRWAGLSYDSDQSHVKTRYQLDLVYGGATEERVEERAVFVGRNDRGIWEKQIVIMLITKFNEMGELESITMERIQ